MPLDSEVVAPVSVRSSSGIRPGPCSLMEPCMDQTEDYGVLVGRTLLIVLPCFSCAGNLVPVSAVSVARAESVSPREESGALPDHLEDIVMGSHPSLVEAGRLSLRGLLHRYVHVFPAPGEPVTGHTTSVQHEILTSDARPLRCGTRRLAQASLRTEQTCTK